MSIMMELVDGYTREANLHLLLYKHAVLHGDLNGGLVHLDASKKLTDKARNVLNDAVEMRKLVDAYIERSES